MSREPWTVLLVRDGDESVRQFGVRPSWIRAGAVVVGLGVAGILAALVFLGMQGNAQLRAEKLAEENRILTAELERMRDNVAELESRVASLTEKSSRFRSLAGLDAIPPEVLEVGVGGPGTPTPETHPLQGYDSAVSESAFAVEYDLNALERRADLLSTSLREATDSLLAHRDLLESTPSILPTAGLLSSRFSEARYHPIHHRPLPHEGVDIAADRGTPILAAAKGTVTRARWLPGYGEMVEIDHGYGIHTRYGHASKVLVREGQEVERGDMIAQVGRTGIATAPNLHYEVRVDGEPTDPMDYVISGAVP